MIVNWLRKHYDKVVKSIAFLPALIALCFLVLSWLMIGLDYSAAGKHLKSAVSWLRLKDASTARSIISSIVSGIISLTVFSFSMVMIILNQAASQMSNRVLDKLIGNRFQQLVLGFYIGTIVYALFLLSTIRDIDSGIYIPALSTYLLISFTVIDIFLFIYFLHFITQSVKYGNIIAQIHDETFRSMQKTFTGPPGDETPLITGERLNLAVRNAGVYQGYNKKGLLKLAKAHLLVIQCLHPEGTFLLKGTPFIMLKARSLPGDDIIGKLYEIFSIEAGQDISNNYYYGFRQLMEIALKALSPGINDPGTAIISLHALADLFAYRLKVFPKTVIRDDEENARVIMKQYSVDELVGHCLLPIWDYGKEDRLVQAAFSSILTQLNGLAEAASLTRLKKSVNRAIEKLDGGDGS